MVESDPGPGGQGQARLSAAPSAINQALAAGTIDRATHLILSVLADLADAAGRVSIRRADIAARTTYSSSTVSRAIQTGIQTGLITQAKPGVGNRQGSTYQFLEGAIGDTALTGAIGSACTRPASSVDESSVSGDGLDHEDRWSEQYREYLDSPEWRNVIERYKRSRPFHCQFSPDRDGCSGPIQLHHLTYERVFTEHLEDLMPLCRWHHEQLHHHFESERRQDPTTTLQEFSQAWVSTGIIY